MGLSPWMLRNGSASGPPQFMKVEWDGLFGMGWDAQYSCCRMPHRSYDSTPTKWIVEFEGPKQVLACGGNRVWCPTPSNSPRTVCVCTLGPCPLLNRSSTRPTTLVTKSQCLHGRATHFQVWECFLDCEGCKWDD